MSLENRSTRKPKGRTRDTDPEKMPITTTGIEMTRGTRKDPAPERLTGGNAVADERGVAGLVLDFINQIRR